MTRPMHMLRIYKSKRNPKFCWFISCRTFLQNGPNIQLFWLFLNKETCTKFYNFIYLSWFWWHFECDSLPLVSDLSVMLFLQQVCHDPALLGNNGGFYLWTRAICLSMLSVTSSARTCWIPPWRSRRSWRWCPRPAPLCSSGEVSPCRMLLVPHLSLFV